jgi:hypothetical protein
MDIVEYFENLSYPLVKEGKVCGLYHWIRLGEMND